MQISTEREAQIFSITAENSSRKIKNELAKHNGWHTYPEIPEPVIKSQYALCHEGGLKKKEDGYFKRIAWKNSLKQQRQGNLYRQNETKQKQKQADPVF